jgi:hypothetical protein
VFTRGWSREEIAPFMMTLKLLLRTLRLLRGGRLIGTFDARHGKLADDSVA